MNVIDVETFGIVSLKNPRPVQTKIAGLLIGTRRELDEKMKLHSALLNCTSLITSEQLVKSMQNSRNGFKDISRSEVAENISVNCYFLSTLCVFSTIHLIIIWGVFP